MSSRLLPSQVTLDELQLPPVSVLKIDVEGFEPLALRGARRLLQDPARRPSFIYLEFKRHLLAHMEDPTAHLRELIALGYHLYLFQLRSHAYGRRGTRGGRATEVAA